MKPPTVGPEGGAGDSDAVPGGIVPPHMSSEWRHLRRALTTLEEAASDARASSTTEEVARHTGRAFTALTDADFWRRRIERNAADD